LQNGYGFLKSALYRQISREFVREEEIQELLWESDNKSLESEVTSVRDILDLLQTKDPGLYLRLQQLLENYKIWLVVNMVKDDRDTMSGLIIREVSTKYLALQPEILGQVSFDLAVEAAVNLMIPFPLDKDESKPAQDLRAVAQKVLEISYFPYQGREAAAVRPTEGDQENEEWTQVWQRAPA
jgi:MinD-like ATPase involved in chromosome partitioning or flagellar assembly